MKKLYTFFMISLTFAALELNAQPVANCSMMCVLDIYLDTVNGEMEVVLFNGDTNMINYPTIQVIDMNGDTVGNPQGLFYFFGQPQGAMTHEIPTTLTSIPSPFYCTVLVTDQVWDTTCYFQYPMSCPLTVQEQNARKEFEVYPNPASSMITLCIPGAYSGKTEVRITNMLGEVFAGTMTAHNGRIDLNVSDLSSGVYFVSVMHGEERYMRKFIRR